MIKQKFFLILFLLISIQYYAYSQCTAQFGYQTDSVFWVHFTDSSYTDSSDNINSWLWMINDSITNNKESFTFQFQDTGTYNVCLVIETNTWCSDSICKNIKITAPDCYTSFTSQHINGYTYSFTNMSSDDLTSWQWDFGDGQTSLNVNPQHTYQMPGDYVVCLISEDQNHICSQQHCDSLIVLDTTPCIADFIYADDNYNVQFTNTSSGPVDAYFWDFGDGNTSTDESPHHTYSSYGDYTVSLIVQCSNSLSPTDTITKQINITYTYSRNPLYIIEGHVYSGSTIYSGNVKVILIKADTLGNYHSIDSVCTSDGSFLLKVGRGDYFIKAIPSEEKYMPTYYYNAVSLENSYKLSVTLNTGSIDIQLAERNNLSTEEIKRPPGIKMYPNPVHDKLYIDIKQTAHLKMYDQTGKLLISKQVEQSAGFDCSEINNGIYLIVVYYKNGLYKKKVIIE